MKKTNSTKGETNSTRRENNLLNQNKIDLGESIFKRTALPRYKIKAKVFDQREKKEKKREICSIIGYLVVENCYNLVVASILFTQRMFGLEFLEHLEFKCI